MATVPNAERSLCTLLFSLIVMAAGCRAQTPAPASDRLSPELTRRVEVLIFYVS